MRQKHHAEVIGLGPVKARTLHENDVGSFQKFLEELTVVFNGIHLGIQSREHVKGGCGTHDGDAGNCREHFVGDVTLATQPPAFAHQIVDGLIAAQRGLNCPLTGNVRAKLHVGEHIEPFDEVFGVGFVAGNHHPARAVAAGTVGLGKRIETQRQHVARETSDCRMFDAVVENLVVDLVGQDNEVVLAGDLNDFEKNVVRVHHACGVVGIDDDDALCARRHFGTDVFDARNPALRFVAEVVYGRSTRKARDRGPKGIVRHRDQEFVAFVKKGFGRHRNEVGRAVPKVDVVKRHALDTL